ncbi:Ras guanine nucleotide exchange factor [Ceratobasidium sp. AG-Ba]|nr:Ras guanine nucleotide exchange factor [Ceratobasidium sp. AG-Ba]
MGVGLRHSWHSLFVRLIRAVLFHPIAPTALLLIMSKSVNSLQAPGAEDAHSRPSVDNTSSGGAPSVKSSSNSSGKSKEKKPRRNTSPVSFYAPPPMKRKTPTTPSKVKLPAPSVRSGASDETFDSTRTARPKVNSEPASLYHPAPLPSKKSRDLRSMSKSTLDLRTPTRDTFSVFSGSSGSGSANGTSSMSPSVASTSLSPSTPVSEEPKTGLRLPALSRRKSAPLHKPSVPPSSELPPVPNDQAPARVSSFRSAPRVQTPTTRDGNTSDHVALAMVSAGFLIPISNADDPLAPSKSGTVVSTQPECVLGIVGSKGSGKSTLIKHAINAVETEESRVVAASADGPTMTLASTTFARGVVRILEINADELLDLSEIKSDKWRLWPDGFPSFTALPSLRYWHELHRSLIHHASDRLQIRLARRIVQHPEIIPERGSKLGIEHGARFLRATHRTPAGVNQMVNAVQWMLDHLAKFRGTKRVIIIPRSKKSAPVPATTELPKSALARTRSAGDIISAWISDSSDASRPTPPVFHPPPPPPQEETPRHSIGEESLLSFGFPKVPNTLPSPIPEQVQQVPTPKPSEEAPHVRAPPLQLKIDGTPSEAPPRKQPAPLCMRWATPEELLDKLFFAGCLKMVQPWFTFNFFLTYRLFMTPRTVLLSFQKRLRDLDEYSDDPILAGFVQQRLCELLQSWIEDYPNDFAAPGAPSALAAVVRTACENTHLMYYGSEFTYFLDELPSLTDDAASWAFVSADTPIEDADSVYEFDLDFNHDFDHGLFGDGQVLFDPGEEPIAPEASRSPPVTASDFGGRRLTRNESIQDEMGVRGMSPDARRGVSPVIKMLASVAMQLLEYSPAQVADEITRLETELFLKIKPRDWVRRGVKEDKLGKPKSIIEMNAFFDRIGKWVMSLVVSLNRAQERARLVTHLCEVAHHLRNLNNYSSLRAFHVGINCVCEQGDVVQSQVPSTVWRKYQSADKLLRVNENHLLYRMAVKNTFGAGILPCREVHSSDLTRIGEMPSTNAEGHIHWAKFTHLGNNIHEINGFQERIREDGQYAFEPNMSLMRLISDPELLDMDTIYERCSQVDRDLQGGYPVPMPTSTASRIHKYLRR